MKTKSKTLALAIFALACIIGGVLGYVKAASLPSLIVGGVGGAVLLLCASKAKKGSRNAAIIALLLSAAIAIRFLVALIETGTLFPHLVMIALAIPAILTAAKAARASRARV